MLRKTRSKAAVTLGLAAFSMAAQPIFQQAHAGQMVVKVGGVKLPWVTIEEDLSKMPKWLAEIMNDPTFKKAKDVVAVISKVYAAISAAKTAGEILGLLPSEADKLQALADQITTTIINHIDDLDVQNLSSDVEAHVINWGLIVRSQFSHNSYEQWMLDTQTTLSTLETRMEESTPEKSAALAPAYATLATLRLAAQHARQDLYGVATDTMSINQGMDRAMQLAYKMVGAERGTVSGSIVRTHRRSHLYGIPEIANNPIQITQPVTCTNSLFGDVNLLSHCGVDDGQVECNDVIARTRNPKSFPYPFWVCESDVIVLGPTATLGQLQKAKKPEFLRAATSQYDLRFALEPGVAALRLMMREMSALRDWGFVDETTNQTVALHNPFFDIVGTSFDGDAVTDGSSFNKLTGQWTIRNSTTGGFQQFPWGDNSFGSVDVPMSGDFDGDGISDAVIYRSGYWHVRPSSGEQSILIGWGSAGDIPVRGDFDGDKITDAVIFRPSNGSWHIKPGNSAPPFAFFFGENGDIPVTADFDGDGKSDATIFRAGFWHIRESTNPTETRIMGWGTQGDIPIAGDFDGDGKSDLVVFRPSTLHWYVRFSTGIPDRVQPWAIPGDKPVAGDFSGNGRSDFTIFRDSNNSWHIQPVSGAPIGFFAGSWPAVPVPVDSN